MLAIFKREFKAYFATPIGYIVLAAFYFFLGLFFWASYVGEYPSVEYIISQMLMVVVFMIPIITMRLMSEDRRQKVDQVLLTAPVKLVSVVVGKYLAAMLLFVICFAPTVIFQIIFMNYATLNVLTYLYTLFGMLLLGSALIAVGMFISCLTESSVVSAIISLFINVLAAYMSSIAGLINVPVAKNFFSKIWSKIVSVFVTVLEKAAIFDRFANFGDKYFSLPDVIYFLSITLAFLFLCVRALERRRWA